VCEKAKLIRGDLQKIAEIIPLSTISVEIFPGERSKYAINQTKKGIRKKNARTNSLHKLPK
jgi:hypothetical protein